MILYAVIFANNGLDIANYVRSVLRYEFKINTVMKSNQKKGGVYGKTNCKKQYGSPNCYFLRF